MNQRSDSVVATTVTAAAGGVGGELMARSILSTMYPGKQASELTQEEKQVVSALGQLAAQLSAGAASGSVEGGIQGAVAGKNAVENNALGSDDDEFQLERGNRPIKIISITPKRIGVVDDDGDVKGLGGIIAGGSTKSVNTVKEPVRFIEGVTVKDIKTGQRFSETVDLNPTLDRITSGGTNPHRNDGSVFKNLPDRITGKSGLPTQPNGYYKEYVHPTPDISGPSPQRVIVGQNGEAYYTNVHYKTFIKIR